MLPTNLPRYGILIAASSEDLYPLQRISIDFDMNVRLASEEMNYSFARMRLEVL